MESAIDGISSEKKAEENLHKQTKQQCEGKLAKLYDEIYQQRKQIITL